MGKVFQHWLASTGFFLLLLVPSSVMGWGYDGHFAVCKIAQGLLTKDVLTAVKALLPEYADGDLAAVCSWADDIRNDMIWSKPLHFVNSPNLCNYNYCRDCHDPAESQDRCVTGAINNYTNQLLSSVHDLNSEMNYNLTEALMFLSHFVGDIHQPLHVAFLGDAGGNTIRLHWYQSETNLHKVWDDKIIESSLKTFYNSDHSSLIEAIESNITGVWFADSLSWESCTPDQVVCPDTYASESIKLACDSAYKDALPGSTLGDEYFLSRLPIVEKRLAQAGVRLAATLNRIFTSTPLISQD